MKKLSLLLSEQILTESRVSQAKSLMDKLFDKMDTNNEKTKSELDSETEESKKKIRQGFTEIKENDPSGNQKYLQWSIRYYIKEYPRYHQNFFITLINDFHELLPYITKKDINSYSSADELGDILGVAREKKDNKEQEKIAKKQVDHVYDDDRWKIIVPKSHMASCVYGAGTQWCTAMKDDDEHFIDYMDDGILFYVLDKKKADREYLYKFAIQMGDHEISKVKREGLNALGSITGYDEKDIAFNVLPVLSFLPKEATIAIEEYINSDKLMDAKNVAANKIFTKIGNFGRQDLVRFFVENEQEIDEQLYELVEYSFANEEGFDVNCSVGDQNIHIWMDLQNDDLDEMEYTTFFTGTDDVGVNLVHSDKYIPYSTIGEIFNRGHGEVDEVIGELYRMFIEDDLIAFYETHGF